MNHRFSFAIALSALLLTACATDQSVDLESRPIALDQNAEPAGAAGVQSAASVASVLPATSPTYLTLTVSRTLTPVTNDKSSSTQPITSGSGFVVSPDGFVVTAAHVAVTKGNEISAVAANGRVYTGTVVGIMPGNDMALIKLRSFSGRTVVPAAPACVAVGSPIYTLGKPHGSGDTARIGTLQAMHFGRAVAYGNFGYPDAMVLHMGTQRGESGGPVFNAQGQFIGMVVSTLSDESGNSINMAHAIPSNTIGRFICSQGACSPNWQAIAAKPVDNCG